MYCVRLVAIALALGAAVPALAQGLGGAGFSSVQTARVVDGLAEDFQVCRKVNVVYRLDCYRQAYSAGARILSNNAAYWEAKVALIRVDRQLGAVLSANSDRSASRLRAGGRRFNAIASAAVPEVAAAFQEAISRAESLLRSGTAAEISNFAPIADVVASSADLTAN